MISLQLFHNKINTLGTMHQVYNSLKVMSILHLKQASVAKIHLDCLIQALAPVTKKIYKNYFRGSIIIIAPKKILCSDFYLNYVEDVKKHLDEIDFTAINKVFIVAECSRYGNYFANSLKLKTDVEVAISNINKCSLWYKEEGQKDEVLLLYSSNSSTDYAILGCNKKSFFSFLPQKHADYDIDAIIDSNKQKFFETTNYLYNINFIYYGYYCNLLEESKERSQVAEGAVKNLSNIINSTSLTMNYQRQNNITNDLGSIVNNMESL